MARLTLTHLPYQILAFTAARTVLNTMHRMVYPFLPVFGRSLGVDLAALSLALSVRSLTGSVGPLLATVADSRGRKAGMVLGLSASPLYLFAPGLLGSAAAAVIFNLCGLMALSWLLRTANEKGIKVA